MSYLFYLFAFILSLQTRWIVKAGELNGGFFEYGTLSVFAVDIVGVVIVGWWCTKKIILSQQKKFLPPPTPSPSPQGRGILTSLTLLSLSTWLLLSLLWNPQPLVAFVWIARLLLAVGVGYIFVQEVKTRGQKFLWTCLGWLVFGVTLQAGLGIYQFLTQSTFANKWLGLAFHDPALGGTFVVETILRRWLRAYGGLPHPNVLGAFIVAALVIVVARYVWKESRIPNPESRNAVQRIGLLVAFIILISGLVLTFSRTAWTAGILVFLVAWCMVVIPPLRLRRGKGELRDQRQVHNSPQPSLTLREGGSLSRLALLTAAAVAIVGMLVVTYPDPFTSRVSGKGRLETKSLNERKTQLAEGWQLFLKRPLQGWGVTSYTRVLRDYVRPPSQPVWEYQPAHLAWLTMLVELGAVGVLLVVWLLIVIASKQKKFLPLKGGGKEGVVSGGRGVLLDGGGYFLTASLLSTTFLQTLTDHFWWTLPVGVWLTAWVIVLIFSVDNLQ